MPPVDTQVVPVRSIRSLDLELALDPPVRFGPVVHGRRSIRLLVIEDGEGHRGWGEVSPLPSFSRDTPADADEAMERARSQLSGDGRTIAAWVECSDPDRTAPAWRFGWETALLRLAADRSGSTFRALAGGGAADRIPSSRLLTRFDPDMIRDALDKGWASFKWKAGRGTLDHDLHVLQSMSGLLEGRAKVRVDANRGWDLEDALRFADRAPQDVVDYIEEPLRAISDLSAFVRESPLPLALDETLREEESSALSELADVFVLKPTLTGGVTENRAWADRARETGKRLVISSAFESEAGLLTLLELALALDISEPAGLDTARYLVGGPGGGRLLPDGPVLNPGEVSSSIEKAVLDTVG